MAKTLSKIVEEDQGEEMKSQARDGLSKGYIVKYSDSTQGQEV